MNVHATLIQNSPDWYVVRTVDGDYDLRHASALSAILQCGEPPEQFGIDAMQQCWGGDDLGEDCVNV